MLIFQSPTKWNPVTIFLSSTVGLVSAFYYFDNKSKEKKFTLRERRFQAGAKLKPEI